jgi:hypothetical protein
MKLIRLLALCLLFSFGGFAQAAHSVTLNWMWVQSSGPAATGFNVYRATMWAEEPKTNPELDAAKARITWLEQSLAVMTNKVKVCFDLYNTDMLLANLAKQEPPKAPPQAEDKK